MESTIEKDLSYMEAAFKSLDTAFFNEELQKQEYEIVFDYKRKSNYYGMYINGNVKDKEDKIIHHIALHTSTLDSTTLPESRIATLHHEMIHMYNMIHNIKDVSGNQIHNKRFKESCIEHELAIQENRNPRYGYMTERELSKMTLKWQEWFKQFNIEHPISEELFYKQYNKLTMEVTGTVVIKKPHYMLQCCDTNQYFKLDSKSMKQFIESGDVSSLHSPFTGGAVVLVEK